jgi:hypothetical protein
MIVNVTTRRRDYALGSGWCVSIAIGYAPSEGSTVGERWMEDSDDGGIDGDVRSSELPRNRSEAGNLSPRSRWASIERDKAIIGYPNL